MSPAIDIGRALSLNARMNASQRTPDVDLSGKVVLITGACGAIAEYVLKALHRRGASIVATDLEPPDTARVRLAEWGLADVAYYRMDVADPKSVESVCADIFAAHPGINVALGHAGGTTIQSFADCDRATFDRIVAFNLMGQTYFARETLRHWVAHRTRGHLIFTSSYASRIPMCGISAYVMSKAGLEMFAKNLALEYAEHGIRVNAVSPGNVAAGSSKLMYDTNPDYRAWVDRISPLGMRNSPEAIANAFVYLCSPLADEVDGHVLQVDAGVSLPKLG